MVVLAWEIGGSETGLRERGWWYWPGRLGAVKLAWESEDGRTGLGDWGQ